MTLTGTDTPANWQTVFRTVTIATTSASAAARTVAFTIGSAIPYSTNGHFYEFVASPAITWANANTAASARFLFGLQGYLATITSAGENDFAASKINGEGWIGANDAAVEGVWKWVAGPENGTQFWSGLADTTSCGVGPCGSAVGGQYANWDNAEPNDWPQNAIPHEEDYAHFKVGGMWNDYAGTNGSIAGYVVEYGGMGGDPVVTLTASRNVNLSQMGGARQGTVVNVEPSWVSTLAGTAGTAGSANGTGTGATLNLPMGITTDGTNLYVAEFANHIIRQIVISTGVVTTVAGTAGTTGSADGTGTAALFNQPMGITTDGANLYVADRTNHTIRQIVISSGVVTTLAGSAGISGSVDGTGAAARFNFPRNLTTDGTNVYVVDTINHTVRQIVIATGAVTTLAGTAGVSGTTDGTGAAARFNAPADITTDGTNLYVADAANNTIRQIVISTGVVTTIAGSGTAGSSDGTSTAAQFNYPYGVTTDGTNLYVVDGYLNSTIRKIVISTGVVTTIAGTTGVAGSTDGAAAEFNGPAAITTDGTNLYVADNGNHTIREIEKGFVVTPSAGAGGTITPSTAQTTNSGSTMAFTVTPDAGYTALVGGTCGGNLVGATYTTNAITANCTVSATFAIDTYTLTYAAGANGSITGASPQTVNHGADGTAVTAVPAAGYHFVNWSDASTANPRTDAGVTGNVTVTANFTLNTYTVTPSAGTGGSISPSTPQTVNSGATTAFTVTPDAGYTASVGGTCGGALVGTTYTTNAITANCSVTASFMLDSYVAPSPTGTGNITASFIGGGPGCGYTINQFIPLTGHAASPPAGTAPAGVNFPHGLFDFTTSGCTPGSTITMVITYPQALPAGTVYWKYGPTPTDASYHWYQLPATIAGNTATFSITDGGLGDDDLTANGTIVDQGGPGNEGGAASIPTLSEWALLMLTGLMGLFGVRAMRRRQAPGL